MLLSQKIAQRYLIADRSKLSLAKRVANSLYPYREEFGPRETLYTAMAENRFWPSGNTLLAGVEPIRPNCCILPAVIDQNVRETVIRAQRLWKARVGIGFDLDGVENPLKVLVTLSNTNAAIDLGHRPQRGNMASISVLHPRYKSLYSQRHSPVGVRVWLVQIHLCTGQRNSITST